MNAFHTYRAMAFLAAITGNVGRPGGGCNFMHNTWPGDLRLPKIQGETPTKKGPGLLGPDTFARAILDEDPYRLRAVFLMGNPLVDSADHTRVRAAYEKLEFLVVPTLFMEESTLYADYVLPVPSLLEQECVFMRRDDRGIRWSNKVPNLFGPAQKVGDDFGLPRYEPANLLLDERHFDALSGQQAYKCFACRVVKA